MRADGFHIGDVGHFIVFMAIEEDQRAPLDDTVDISNEATQADEEWPVAEHYRIEALDLAPETEPDRTAAMAQGEQAQPPPPEDRRRLSPANLGLVLLLAIAAVLFLVGAAAWFMVEDSGTVATAAADGPRSSSPEPTRTTPATSLALDLEKPLPDLTGVSLAEATALLERADLRVRVRNVTSDRPRGEISGQDPAAGTRVRADSVVVLVVSRGPQGEIAKAPNLVGLRASEAAKIVRRVGLRAQLHLVSSNRPRGTIVSQKPSAGTEMVAGSTIRLAVAIPQPTVMVPSVLGWSASDARGRLRALGFTSSTIGVSSNREPGTVVGQSPSAGAKLRKGATVTLKISTGPADVVVPHVTGLDETSASAELQSAGFEVSVVDEPTPDAAQDGVVVRQDPMGGSSVTRGAAVTITVLRFG